MSDPSPLNTDRVFHEGRGPELRRIHWDIDGRVILAIDYFNPTDTHDVASVKHVRFLQPQVVMVTPEEVVGGFGPHIAEHRPAAMFDCGRDAWFQTFAPTHLDRSSHFQLLFYDEVVDVICEGVECVEGEYRSATAG